MTTIELLEQALAKRDETLAAIARAEDWLKTHSKTHRLYPEAQRRCQAHRATLQRLDDEIEGLERQNAVEGAKWRGYAFGENTAPPSLNCMVCGKPVNGWPKPLPGHYVHLDCWGSK